MSLTQRIRHQHQHQSGKLQKLAEDLSAALSPGFAGPLLAARFPNLVAAVSDSSASSTAAADGNPFHASTSDLRSYAMFAAGAYQPLLIAGDVRVMSIDSNAFPSSAISIVALLAHAIADLSTPES